MLRRMDRGDTRLSAKVAMGLSAGVTVVHKVGVRNREAIAAVSEATTSAQQRPLPPILKASKSRTKTIACQGSRGHGRTVKVASNTILI